ncbi:methyl-accepting chemotaxis protein [Cupriavidus plantarum]|uniref:Methyl-accepting chemotaxis protein-1 (Serine sensor receptor) n=1 Tax=Cupriavidus plantarum TaxID=942865 RepID=A0A316EP96_9BURK|nr:methyl-accepting chemotaxis protein [Cupriavidus plantarum]PWK33895.1 methyl-accepting chemotaxis protein-1 (serine sensor receptor) [Cupriavidus plantarum]
MPAFLFPAVRLMARLSIHRKLLLLTALFLIPLGGALFAVFAQSVQAIGSTRDELRGLVIVERALDFMRETQVRRGAANGVLSGNKSFQATFDQADAKAAEHLAALLADVAKAPDFAVEADARKLDEAWQQIRRLGLNTPAPPLFDRHSVLVKQTRLFVGDVADRSSLALDPDAGSYYLINLMVSPMPRLAELGALARGRGAGIIARGGFADATQQAELATLAEQIQDSLESVRRDVGRVARGAPAYRERVEAAAKKLAAMDNFYRTMKVSMLGSSGITIDAKNYFAEGTAAIDGVSDVMHEFAALTREMLDARMAGEQRQLILLGVVALLTVGTACYLFAGFSVGMREDVRDVAELVTRINAGDLGVSVEARGRDELSEVKRHLMSMVGTLRGLIGDTKEGAQNVLVAANEIAQGNTDLSQRTEEQASSLEQTAASMEQLTSIVQQNAGNAQQASELAGEASRIASDGGASVARMRETMGEIEADSRRIVEIIAVIDSIAFQTNILALNAAVEAARAGEYGRGFAVVASEVRSLAQRAANSAKEIRTLISQSVQRVASGNALAGETADTMHEIVAAVRRVTSMMDEISTASHEQSSGIAQVNQAVTQMDQVTQQNAALVEEAAAAAQALHEQALRMERSVSVFRLTSV